MGTETQILEQGFRMDTQELSDIWTTFNLDFLTRNPEIAGEIQILRLGFSNVNPNLNCNF